MVGLAVFGVAVSRSAPVGAEADETPWLGVSIRDGSGHGVLISEVIDGTPAAASGLVAGDLVVSLGGTPLRYSEQLIAVVRSHRIDDELELTFIRNEALHKTTARLIAFESDPDAVLARRLVDRPAPEIEFERLPDRRAGTLSSLRGRPVVLIFFATSCGSCATLFDRLSVALAGEGHERARVRFLAVASDPPAAMAAYLSRVKLPPEFIIAAELSTEPELRSVQRYALDRVPLVVILDRQGVVRFASYRADDSEILDNAALTLSRLRARGPL